MEREFVRSRAKGVCKHLRLPCSCRRSQAGHGCTGPTSHTLRERRLYQQQLAQQSDAIALPDAVRQLIILGNARQRSAHQLRGKG